MTSPPLRVLLHGRRSSGRLDPVSGLLAAVRRAGSPTVHVDDAIDVPALGPLLDRFRPHVLVRVGADPSLPPAVRESLHARGVLALGWRLAAPAPDTDHDPGPDAGLDLLAATGGPPPAGVLALPPAADRELLDQPLPAPAGPVRDVLVLGHATGRADWHAVAGPLVQRLGAVTLGAGWPRGWGGSPDGARLLQALRHGRVHVHLAAGAGPFLSVAAGGAVAAPVASPAAGQLDRCFPAAGESLRFTDPADAVEQVAALLADPDRLAATRDAAVQRLRREHLYEHRWAALVGELVRRAGAGERLADPDLARRVLERAREEAAGPPRRVVVSGWYGAGNAGDELILESLARRVEADVPGAQVVVAARHPAAVLAGHGLEAFDRLDPVAAEDEAARAAAVLLGGGGLWEDYTFGQNGAVAGLVTGATASPSGLAVLPLLARVHRRPVHVVGMGVGPLADPGARAVVAHVGNQAASVTVRDPGSRDLLVGIDGWEAPVEVAPDPVYALEPGPLLAPRYAAPAGRPVVGVNLRAWGAAAEGLADAVARALAALVRERDAVVVGIPLDPRDAARLADVLGRCGAGATVLAPCSDLEQLLADLAGCDLLLSMRLHGCLLGHRAGVPVVGLGYDPKVTAHFAELGRERYVVPLEDAADRLGPVLAETLGEGLPDPAREAVRDRQRRAGAALGALTTRLAALPPPPEPPRPLPWLDDALPGRLTLPLAAADVTAGSTLTRARRPPFRAVPVQRDLVLGLSESAPLAGDVVRWRAVVPAAGSGNGRRVRLRLHCPYREDPARTGRLAWQVLAGGRALVTEDVAGWSEPVTCWLGWGPGAGDVDLEVRLLALRDCEDWRWGRAAGLRLEPPEVHAWTGGAALPPGQWVASCSSPGAAVLA